MYTALDEPTNDLDIETLQILERIIWKHFQVLLLLFPMTVIFWIKVTENYFEFEENGTFKANF